MCDSCKRQYVLFHNSDDTQCVDCRISRLLSVHEDEGLDTYHLNILNMLILFRDNVNTVSL